MDRSQAAALADFVQVGFDVRIPGIVFVERLDVVEQYLGVTHDDEGTLDVVAVLGIGRGRNVFDGDVSRTREVPRAFLSRSSGVVELDAGFLIADPVGAVEADVDVETRFTIDEHVARTGGSEYPARFGVGVVRLRIAALLVRGNGRAVFHAESVDQLLGRPHAFIAAELPGRSRPFPMFEVVADADHHHLAVPVLQENVAAGQVRVERSVGVVLLVEVENSQVDDIFCSLGGLVPLFGVFSGRKKVFAVRVDHVGVGRVAVELVAGGQQQYAAFESHAHGQCRPAVILVGLYGEVQRQAVVVDHVVQFADDVIHALVVGTARQVHLHIVAVEVARKDFVAQQYARTVLAQQAVIEPGAQEAGFVLVLFDDDRAARRIVEHLLVRADVLDEVGCRTDAPVVVRPVLVVVRRCAPVAEVHLEGVVILAVVGNVQVVRTRVPGHAVGAVRLVADVAVNGSQVFLGVGGALEYLLDGDPVVGNLVEEVVVAGGQDAEGGQ